MMKVKIWFMPLWLLVSCLFFKYFFSPAASSISPFLNPPAELKKMESDPTYNINVSGDIKQMLRELGTDKAKEIAKLGGGGNKARSERAAALAAILEARSRIKEESSGKGESPKQGFSIVDAASASVQGRSANAAKTASNDKTAARIALHMAGERAPVNAKLVSFLLH